mgnify:CR=1 FL=1
MLTRALQHSILGIKLPSLFRGRGEFELSGNPKTAAFAPVTFESVSEGESCNGIACSDCFIRSHSPERILLLFPLELIEASTDFCFSKFDSETVLFKVPTAVEGLMFVVRGETNSLLELFPFGPLFLINSWPSDNLRFSIIFWLS